jgi:hypothetical protein
VIGTESLHISAPRWPFGDLDVRSALAIPSYLKRAKEPGEGCFNHRVRPLTIQRPMDREHVAHFAVVPLGPTVGAGHRIYELRATMRMRSPLRLTLPSTT